MASKIDLSDFRTWIGKDLSHIVKRDHYNEEANFDAIRHFADGLLTTNPLHRDAHYASSSPYGKIIAPPAFLYTVFGGWRSGHTVNIPGERQFFSGAEWQWFRPVYLGDRLEAKCVITHIVEKEGRFAGPIAFYTAETTYFNQNEAVVAIDRSTSARVAVAEIGKRQKYAAPTVAAASAWRTYHEYLEEEGRRRGAAPLYWEDVAEGSQITPLTRATLTITEIVAWSGATFEPRSVGARSFNKDWDGRSDNPGRGHWDPEVGQQLGMGGAYDLGPQRVSWMAQFLFDWIGDHGKLQKMDLQIRRPNLAGDTTRLEGRVSRKYATDLGKFLECDVQCVNQRGESTAMGVAVVQLPTRA